MIKKCKGFTLVELLAVIVILAIILVIAVPKVMSVIEDSKKATLESTAKMIAGSAEKIKVQNTVLGKDETITCDSVAKINSLDYETCELVFEDNTAKVTIKGSGKFAGLYVCDGDKSTATAQTKECQPAFEVDDWLTIVTKVKSGNYPYQVGNSKTIEMDIDDNGEKETYTIRVANTTKCSDEWEADVTKSQTACGFVLEFADVIAKYNMNPADEYNGIQYDKGYNLGGWPNTKMREYLNDLDSEDDEDGVIYNALPEELRNGIIDTYVVSSHGSFDEGKIGENNNFGSTDKLYLLSLQEIYGTTFDSSLESSYGTSRQLDYYEDNEITSRNYEDTLKNYSTGDVGVWWLRSASIRYDYAFFFITRIGDWGSSNANYSYGVSPAFRLAD